MYKFDFLLCYIFISENSHDFALQQTYITGLQNIKSQEIVEHFEPLIFGRKTFESNYLQEAALRAVSALFTKDPVKVSLTLYYSIVFMSIPRYCRLPDWMSIGWLYEYDLQLPSLPCFFIPSWVFQPSSPLNFWTNKK